MPLLAVGCSSAPLVPPGVLDVTGTWDGVWNGGAIGAGRVSLVLKQTGTNVHGELSISGALAISATDGPIDGRVAGNTFSFEQPAGFIEAQMTVDGEQMKGYATGRLMLAMSLQRQPKPKQ